MFLRLHYSHEKVIEIDGFTFKIFKNDVLLKVCIFILSIWVKKDELQFVD